MAADREHALIKRYLERLTPQERRFRINAGMGWTGQVTFSSPDTVVIKQARPLHGAPVGFPDVIGWDMVTVTPDMVGRRIAVFVGEEFKTGNGQLSKAQRLFRDCLERMGGIFRVIREV
jgi:hypothetical protein